MMSALIVIIVVVIPQCPAWYFLFTTGLINIDYYYSNYSSKAERWDVGSDLRLWIWISYVHLLPWPLAG